MNENDEEDDFLEGDYGFIIGPDGELKSMMFPEDLMEEPPKTIRKILKIFGIANLNDMIDPTLH